MKSIAIPLATLMLLPLSSCGDDTTFVPTPGAGEPLDPTISEPPLGGDADGNEYEGNWDVDLYWSDCSGTCAVDTAFGVASVRDIGDTDRDNADITQSRSLTVGTVEGQSVNCWGTVDVTGTRAN